MCLGGPRGKFLSALAMCLGGSPQGVSGVSATYFCVGVMKASGVPATKFQDRFPGETHRISGVCETAFQGFMR